MLKIFIIKALFIQVINLQWQIKKVTILGSGAFFTNCEKLNIVYTRKRAKKFHLQFLALMIY